MDYVFVILPYGTIARSIVVYLIEELLFQELRIHRFLQQMMKLFSSLLHKDPLIYYCWKLFHYRLFVYKNSQCPVVRYPDQTHKCRLVLNLVDE